MTLRFTVLASGSSGNVSLVVTGGRGVLIDLGLGPRQLGDRLQPARADWSCVSAVLLTHPHGDHWNEASLDTLRRRQIRLYCHPDHHDTLTRSSPGFAALLKEGLVSEYVAGATFELPVGLRIRPLPLQHDASATFGFRLDGPGDIFGEPRSIGYAADLGCWTPDLVAALADVDLLALEFNHDEKLEKRSGRPWHLIARVMGENGHLSNHQAAALLDAVVRRSSSPDRLKHLVQLHLSRQCNEPGLASATARRVLAAHGLATTVHTAAQDRTGPTLVLGEPSPRRRASAGPGRRTGHSGRVKSIQPWLPGFGPEPLCSDAV